MMEYKKLTDDELADFLQRACVQLVPELTQQLLSLGSELAEYRAKIEQRTLIELPRMFQNINKIGWFVEYIGDCGWIKSEYHSTEEKARERLKELQNG